VVLEGFETTMSFEKSGGTAKESERVIRNAEREGMNNGSYC